MAYATGDILKMAQDVAEKENWRPQGLKRG
jgi:hypothetical protein